MKKFSTLFLVMFAFVTLASAQVPTRDAKEVPDVGGTVTPNYIVFPKEEPQGDHKVTNAPECDIKAVTAANDKKRLRIGIVLHNSITFTVKVVYGIKLIYSGGIEEWYVYNPVDKQLIYIKRKGEKTIKTEAVAMSKESDNAYVASQIFADGKKMENSVVTLLLDKDKHVDKASRGKKLFLTVQAFSGYIKDGTTDDIGDADETISVKMNFIR